MTRPFRRIWTLRWRSWRANAIPTPTRLQRRRLANAKATIQFKQWRNKCYQDTYEPGSTFKPVTLATALEEGLVNLNTTFTCNGSIRWRAGKAHLLAPRAAATAPRI